MKAIIVYWQDSSAESAHIPPEVAAATRCYDAVTIGFVLREDEREIVLAMETYDDGTRKLCRNIVVIPKCAISKIDDIETIKLRAL